MKKTWLTTLILLAAAFGYSNSFANGIYAEAGLGLHIPMGYGFDLGPGFAFGFGAGYKFPKTHWRAEFAYHYLGYSAGHGAFHDWGGDWNGSFDAFMFNGLYDFMYSPRILGYFGGGLGFLDGDFGLQGIGGARYLLNAHVSVGGEYHFIFNTDGGFDNMINAVVVYDFDKTF